MKQIIFLDTRYLIHGSLSILNKTLTAAQL